MSAPKNSGDRRLDEDDDEDYFDTCALRLLQKGRIEIVGYEDGEPIYAITPKGREWLRKNPNDGN